MENPENWQQIKCIVGDALERSPEKRAAFVCQACGTDGALRLEVESLLSAYDRSEGLSESAVTAQVNELPCLLMCPNRCLPALESLLGIMPTQLPTCTPRANRAGVPMINT